MRGIIGLPRSRLQFGRLGVGLRCLALGEIRRHGTPRLARCKMPSRCPMDVQNGQASGCGWSGV
jgi:hypothetical protein